MVHHVADSKGKIEAGIKYVQSNALQGRVFDTLAAQNSHLTHWESRVADLRIHGTTKRQVCQVFEEIERPALLPLPAERFPFFHEAQRIVHRDGHVQVDKAYYSHRSSPHRLSLAGCSPAEPASVSPDDHSLRFEPPRSNVRCCGVEPDHYMESEE